MFATPPLPPLPIHKQDIIRQFACIGMSKAFKRHIGATWLSPQEYVYGVGGKTEKLVGKGKKTKANKVKVPVR